MPNHFFGPSGPGADNADDALSPALSALDARLRQDGAHWREAAPNPAQWLPDLSPRSAQSAHPSHAAKVTTLSERRLTFDGSAAPTTPRHVLVHRPSRLGTIAAGGSALLVVALLALLLHGLVGTRGTSTAQKTSAATPKTLQPASEWTTNALTGMTNTVPVVAPSDPNVIYVPAPMVGPSLALPSLAFKRSDDGGKTWHALSAPTTDVANDLSNSSLDDIVISPTDAHTIIVTVQSTYGNTLCPTPYAARVGGNINASGYTACNFLYVSHDGGATWTKPSVPDGVKVEAQPVGTASVSLSGKSLVMHADANPNSSAFAMRLLRTTDDGTTWVYADQGLRAQGRAILTYLADPTGPGAWAMTIPPTSQGSGGDDQLWRTDDGTTWHQATLPSICLHQGDGNVFKSGHCELIGSALSGHTPLLYLGYLSDTSGQNPPKMGSPAIMHIAAITDAGQTWQTLPSAGIPVGTQLDITLHATLDDGTLIMMAGTGVYQQGATGLEPTELYQDAAFYAWHPGASSWQHLTPALPKSEPQQAWVTPLSGGGYTLWSLSEVSPGNQYDLCSASLALK